MKSTYYAAGLFFGIAIVAIISLVTRFLSKDKGTTKYDEMQERTRGIAYKYAFWTVLLIEGLLGVLGLTEAYSTFPLRGFMLHFTVMIIGIMVQVCYSIWHHAYIGLNTNVKKFIICCSFLSIANFLGAIRGIAQGTMLVDGILEFPYVQLLCALMFIIIAVEFAIRNHLDKKED